MVEITVEVFTWTPEGMRPSTDTREGYIPVREVERLLEEAHARGANVWRDVDPKCIY